jgi:hypothetical protein
MKRGTKRRRECTGTRYEECDEEPVFKRQHVKIIGNAEMENALADWCDEMKRFAVTLDIRMAKSITVNQYHNSTFPGIMIRTTHMTDDCIYANYVLSRQVIMLSVGTECVKINGHPRPTNIYMLVGSDTADEKVPSDDTSDEKVPSDDTFYDACRRAFLTYMQSTSPYRARNYIAELERVYEDLEARAFDIYAAEIHNATGLLSDLVHIILEM